MIGCQFAVPKEQFDRVSNVAAEQKKQKETVELVDDIIKDNNPFQNVSIEDAWIEDDLFDSKDSEPIIDASTKIIDEITQDPLIDIDIATPSTPPHLPPPDTNDEIENDIDSTITDYQVIEGNDGNVNKSTELFVDFTVAD